MTQLTLPPGVPWEHSTSGATWESNDPASCTNNKRWVPHSSPVFGLEWDTQHLTTPQSRSCVIRSEGEGPAFLSTSSRSTGAPHPGFPVNCVDELHPAFLNESRTRGRCLVPRTGKSGHLARFSRDVGYHCSPPCHPESRGASWGSNDPASCTGNERWVPHSSPVFGLEWDTQHLTTPQSPSCVIRSEAEASAVLSASSRSTRAPQSGDVGHHCSPPGHPACQGLPWEQSKEMTQQNSPRMRGPEGRLAKLQPSPEGLGIHPEDDMSAVGAALNPASTRVIPRPQP
jgi:hypothetical protein